jgi:NADPH-dependent ferric siderophore reductase
LRAIEFPPERDDVFAWVGAEYSAFRSIRGYLRREIGLSAAQMIAFSHWRRGMSEDDIVDVGISSVSA